MRYTVQEYSEPSAVELEKINISRGWLGRFWGQGQDAKTNIAGIVAIIGMLAFLVLTFRGDVQVIDRVLPVVTSVIGFVGALFTTKISK